MIKSCCGFFLEVLNEWNKEGMGYIGFQDLGGCTYNVCLATIFHICMINLNFGYLDFLPHFWCHSMCNKLLIFHMFLLFMPRREIYPWLVSWWALLAMHMVYHLFFGLYFELRRVERSIELTWPHIWYMFWHQIYFWVGLGLVWVLKAQMAEYTVYVQPLILIFGANLA